MLIDRSPEPKTTPRMGIDGHTRFVAHLAHPTGHLRTPLLFNAKCAERDINMVLIPWDVAPDSLERIVDSLRSVKNCAGMIVTIPHKASVVACCDRLEGVAIGLRVVNVIRREADGTLVGRLYDGAGFVDGLRSEGIDPAGKRVLVLGAGGAGTAIAGAFAASGTARLVIANRDRRRASELVARLRALHPGQSIETGEADGRGFNLIANATSVGLDGDTGIPIPPETIEAGCVVAEAVMKPAMTPLLRAAQSRGARIHLGEHMLAAQIEHFLRFLADPGPIATSRTAPERNP
jgi:shikimate dehydrogenase